MAPTISSISCDPLMRLLQDRNVGCLPGLRDREWFRSFAYVSSEAILLHSLNTAFLPSRRLLELTSTKERTVLIYLGTSAHLVGNFSSYLTTPISTAKITTIQNQHKNHGHNRDAPFAVCPTSTSGCHVRTECSIPSRHQSKQSRPRRWSIQTRRRQFLGTAVG